MAPASPGHNFTAIRTTANQFSQRFMSLRQYSSSSSKIFIGTGADENTILSKEIGIVVAIIAAGINAIGIAVNQLENVQPVFRC